ncbi:MAG: peptide MFS transporter [Desulfomonilaceae bacterium]|nr:peptide MFS transporter [Desulfomonilaceae bacterium]
MPEESVQTPTHKKDLWGHPRGLFVLFLTEMWERFSYYGMRAILVYYMVKHLMFDQGYASHIYGLYTGLVYLTPFFGGILADRAWGQRRTVVVGGVLMAIGHFLMAFESLFFPALGFLILGNGAFKPNISTQVGNLYPENDPRRDRAFSIFYVGINLGAFFSPLVCGTLGELYGWHWGFGAAGVGMVVGLTIYLSGRKWLAPDNLTTRARAGDTTPTRLSPDEKGRVAGLIAVGLVSVAFWAAFEQQGNTIALWGDANTDRRLLGWEFPASWFQSLNPAFVFLCTPLITTFWGRQSRADREPSAVTKMAIGCFLLACGFIVMIPAAMGYSADGMPVSSMWLVAFTLLVTLGELYLSPVGLSLVTKISPPRIVSMMMGTWFLASFLGNYGAGFLGAYWEVIPKHAYFLMIALIGFAAGVAILLIQRPLKRVMVEGKRYS